MTEKNSKAIAAQAVATPRDKIVKKDKPHSTPNLEPEWKVFLPLNFIAKDDRVVATIKKTRSTLKKTSKTLEKIMDLIDSARSVLNIVKVFEKVVKNLLYTFLNLIIDQLQTILNDFKSTGVYSLDLISYHWVNNTDEDNATDKSYEATLKEGPWFYTGPQFSTAQENAFSQGKNENESSVLSTMARFLRSVDKSYQRETYYEFIETICEAFSDSNDIASGQFAYCALNNDKNSIFYEADGIAVKTTRHTDTSFGYTLPQFLQSGRPDFGPEGYMKVYLIAYAMPDIGNVVRLVTTLIDLFGNLIPVKSIYTGLKQYDVTLNEWKTNVNKTTDNITSNLSSTWDNTIVEIKAEFDKVFGVITTPAKEPNFVGVNLYTVFAPYFDYLQSLLNVCRTLANKEIPGIGGLIETLEGWLDDLETQINRLLNLIEMIENFIRLLEAILSITGLRILSFDTKEGIDGVIKGLRNSKNFGANDAEQNLLTEKVTAQQAKKYINETKLTYEAELKQENNIRNRLANLNNLNDIVKEWWIYATTNNLFVLREQLETASISWNNLIEDQNNLKNAIIDNHEDINELSYKKDQLTLEWTNANEGFMLGDDYVPGYIVQLETLNTQRDLLIAQHDDPLAPEIPDYDTKLNDLNAQIATLTQVQAQGLNNYNYEFNNYAWVQTNITSDPYNEQLVIANNNFQITKNNNNPDYSGSDAEVFKLLEVTYLDSINILNTDIDLLNDELAAAYISKNTVYNTIYAYNSYAYLINADDYPESGGLPPITDPAPWNDINFRNLFTEPNGYWVIVARIAQIPIDIANKEVLITQLENDIEDNKTAWDLFSADNMMYQMRYMILRFVLTKELEKIAIDDEIIILTNNKNIDLQEKNEEIIDIIKNGWDNYLSRTVIYYKQTVPYTKDGIVLGDWTDNEIGYLIWKEGYNMKEPLMVDNLCPAIENAIVLTTNDIEVFSQNSKSALDTYEQAVKEENERLNASAVVKNSSWDPLEKMYYGGYLFCLGWPTNLKDRVSKDIGQIYRDNFQDPLMDETKLFKTLTGNTDVGKQTGKLLNWMFK